jgi:hypothetical protein
VGSTTRRQLRLERRAPRVAVGPGARAAWPSRPPASASPAAKAALTPPVGRIDVARRERLCARQRVPGFLTAGGSSESSASAKPVQRHADRGCRPSRVSAAWTAPSPLTGAKTGARDWAWASTSVGRSRAMRGQHGGRFGRDSVSGAAPPLGHAASKGDRETPANPDGPDRSPREQRSPDADRGRGPRGASRAASPAPPRPEQAPRGFSPCGLNSAGGSTPRAPERPFRPIPVASSVGSAEASPACPAEQALSIRIANPAEITAGASQNAIMRSVSRRDVGRLRRLSGFSARR